MVGILHNQERRLCFSVDSEEKVLNFYKFFAEMFCGFGLTD